MTTQHSLSAKVGTDFVGRYSSIADKELLVSFVSFVSTQFLDIGVTAATMKTTRNL
jgi:hypothetical protein